MANPLTLYVQIKQDATSQATAQFIYDSFGSSTHASLLALNIVHYARVALIPNAGSSGINAVLLLTEFDGDMNTYLLAFFNEQGGGIKEAFVQVANIALNPPAGFDPTNVTYPVFSAFINNNNLNVPADNFSAYQWTVQNILNAPCLPQS